MSKYSVSLSGNLGTLYSTYLGPNSAKVPTPKVMVKVLQGYKTPAKHQQRLRLGKKSS